MDVLYRAGWATVADVLGGLPDPPSYSAVRAQLRILEDKGYVRHAQDGRRYVFSPTLKRDRVKESALRDVIDTFFEGSAAQVVAALVEMSDQEMDADELRRLRRLIDEARKGRK